MTSISIIKGDITKQVVDAIVNAANTSLSDGGGVNGAIQQAAGRALLEECRSLNGCSTGEAKITKGYNLPAKFIIHAVGPVWQGGDEGEQQQLYHAYYNSLLLAMQNHLRTIAFPNISTGIYGFPKQLAAGTALKAVSEFCKANPNALSEIIFVCFDEENYTIYHDLLTPNPR